MDDSNDDVGQAVRVKAALHIPLWTIVTKLPELQVRPFCLLHIPLWTIVTANKMPYLKGF